MRTRAPMSEMGQQRRFGHVRAMSAHPQQRRHSGHRGTSRSGQKQATASEMLKQARWVNAKIRRTELCYRHHFHLSRSVIPRPITQSLSSSLRKSSPR